MFRVGQTVKFKRTGTKCQVRAFSPSGITISSVQHDIIYVVSGSEIENV